MEEGGEGSTKGKIFHRKHISTASANSQPREGTPLPRYPPKPLDSGIGYHQQSVGYGDQIKTILTKNNDLGYKMLTLGSAYPDDVCCCCSLFQVAKDSQRSLYESSAHKDHISESV